MYEFKITSVNRSAYKPEDSQPYLVRSIPAVIDTDFILETYGRPEKVLVDPLSVNKDDINPFWYLDFTYEEIDSDGYKSELDGQAILTRTPHANGTFIWEVCCPDGMFASMIADFIIGQINEVPATQMAAE